MDARSENPHQENAATVERTSDREIVVSRAIHGPAHVVFEAWTKPELFKRWWVPKSVPISLVSCDLDARVGGGYRLVFDVGGSKTMAFFGKYLEVTPPSRIVWTNEEGADQSVTTVTFTEEGGQTLVRMSELYPSQDALDNAITCGSQDGTRETFDQLEEFISTSVGAATSTETISAAGLP